MSLFLAFGPLAVAEEGSAEGVPLITGVREWRMVDGTAKRMHIAHLSEDGTFVYLHDRKSKGQIPGVAVTSLVPDQREVLLRLHEGKVKLAKVPGLSIEPDFPSGKLAEGYDSLLVGETREWHHVNGKKVAAQLLNLTDDDVSLLLRGSVLRVALKDLSEEDRDYTERVKDGRARLFVQEVDVHGGGWDSAPRYRIPVSGERYAAMAAGAGDFERALEVAMKEAAEGLKGTEWELESLEEQDASRLPARPGVDKTGEVPRLCIATFFLSDKAYREARRRWPLTTTPERWPGDKQMLIHMTADGEVLSAVRERSGR